MKRLAEDKAKAEDLDLREMVVTIYSAMVTPKSTVFNRNPSPGLIDRVQSIDDRLINHEKVVNDLVQRFDKATLAAVTEVKHQEIERARVQARDAVT